MREMLNVFLQSLQNPATYQARPPDRRSRASCGRYRLHATSYEDDYGTSYTSGLDNLEDCHDAFSDDLQEAIELESLKSVPDYMCPLLG